MAIDGLTTLTTLLQGNVGSNASNVASSGAQGINVIPAATQDVDVVNRMAGTHSGLVNPKKGMDPMEDEGESYPFYAEEEEEEDEFLDWSELEEEAWEEDEDELEEYLTFKREKGMFVDIQA